INDKIIMKNFIFNKGESGRYALKHKKVIYDGIKRLKPMAYRLRLLIYFSVLSNLSNAFAQHLGTAEGQRDNRKSKISEILAPKVEYVLEHDIKSPLGSEGNGMGQVKPIVQTILTG